jgi:hypothetical protein
MSKYSVQNEIEGDRDKIMQKGKEGQGEEKKINKKKRQNYYKIKRK